MSSDGNESESASKLFSVPGMVALAVLGLLIVGASRLLGTDVILREVVTEVIASLGSAILVLAVFGLFFGSGIERLLRRAPGGDVYAKSARRMQEILREPDQRGLQQDQTRVETGFRTADDTRLDRIEEDIRFLVESGIPELQDQVRDLRELLKAEHDRED